MLLKTLNTEKLGPYRLRYLDVGSE